MTPKTLRDQILKLSPNQRLELVEVHPHAILRAGDFGRIGAAARDRGNDDRVAHATRCARDDDRVTDLEPRVGR